MEKYLSKDGLEYLIEGLDPRYAKERDLADVAKSGSYDDLTDKPSIPSTPGDIDAMPASTTLADLGGIALTEKGANSGVAPLNAGGKIDSQYLPSYVDDVIECYVVDGYEALSANWLSKTDGGYPLLPEGDKIYVILSSGDYLNKVYRWGGTAYVSIGGDIDLSAYATQTWVQNQNYLTSHQDISGKANSADLATVATSGDYTDLINKPTIPRIPSNVSEFTNDAGYLTQHQSLSGYATETWVGNQGFLTSHQDISGKVDSSDLADVATSGDYDDLINKPTIPTVVSSIKTGSGIFSEVFNYDPDYPNIATASNSHAEGRGSKATGGTSHAEGLNTQAKGNASHAEGDGTEAWGNFSHAEGQATYSHSFQHAQGKYNIKDTYGIFLDIVGNGNDSQYPAIRSNASALDWNGNLYLAGDVYVGCDDYTTTSNGLTTAGAGGTKLSTFSGSYNDLTDKPTLFSGSYNDLTNKPTIPAAYTLPTASTSTLGGVKVDGSTITINNGIISASGSSYTAGNGIDITNGEISFDDAILSDYVLAQQESVDHEYMRDIDEEAIIFDSFTLVDERLQPSSHSNLRADILEFNYNDYDNLMFHSASLDSGGLMLVKEVADPEVDEPPRYEGFLSIADSPTQELLWNDSIVVTENWSSEDSESFLRRERYILDDSIQFNQIRLPENDGDDEVDIFNAALSPEAFDIASFDESSNVLSVITITGASGIAFQQEEPPTENNPEPAEPIFGELNMDNNGDLCWNGNALAFAADVPEIPSAPVVDGTYMLICEVTNGEPAYSWESVSIGGSY